MTGAFCSGCTLAPRVLELLGTVADPSPEVLEVIRECKACLAGGAHDTSAHEAHDAVTAWTSETTEFSSFSSDSDGIEPRGHALLYADVWRTYPEEAFSPENYEIKWGPSNQYLVNNSKLIGTGSYGEVFLTKGKDGRTYVAKMFKKDKEKPIKVQKEVQMLRLMEKKPYVITLIDAVVFGSSKALIFPYVRNPPYKEAYVNMTDLEARSYLFRLLVALESSHSMGVIHRDLKGGNVLYDPKTKKLALIDWGFAEFYRAEEKKRSFPGTRIFKGPELLLSYPYYDYAVDMWAYGCVLGGVIFHSTLFKCSVPPRPKPSEPKSVQLTYRTLSSKIQLAAIIGQLGSDAYHQYLAKYNKEPYMLKQRKFKDVDALAEAANLSPPPRTRQAWDSYITEANRALAVTEALLLLDSLLVFDHEKRLVASQALMHPYFDPVRNESVGPYVCLPPGWERRVDPRGAENRVYFYDHNTKTKHRVAPTFDNSLI